MKKVILRSILCLPLIICASQAMSGDLKAPFATRGVDPKASTKPCASLSKPVVSFDLQSKYGNAGSRRDSVDDDAEAAFESAMQPIKDFMGDVVKAANDYHRTGRLSAAQCSMAQMAHWAKADALSGPESHTSYYKLATTVAGLSSAFMQIEPALSATHPDKAIVKAWLAKRGRQIQQYFETLKTPRSSRNNHRAWAGLAVASAGVVADDSALLNWGLASYRLVVCQATAEGALPLEIERGSKAREYHFYALAALAPLAEIGQRNGQQSYGLCQDALHRIAAYTVQSVTDPAAIAAAAGTKQSGGNKPPSASRLTFLEPYKGRFPERLPASDALLRVRPLGLTDLGGNQTILYARKP